VKAKNLALLLGLAFVLAASFPSMADTWTPYYTYTYPVNPPGTPGAGGPGWTQFIDPIPVPRDGIYIGVKNEYRDGYVKTGVIELTYRSWTYYSGSYLLAEGFAVGGEPDNRPASWNDPSQTYITPGGWEDTSFMDPNGSPPYTGKVFTYLNFFPQPGWEWVKFDNQSVSGNFGTWITGIYISTDCTPVPLPGSIVLFGSGLLGLAGWRQLKKG
jgi:hypothetical protein